MREFPTGATRNDEEGKYDYEGFLSPLVLERYAQYMHKHRMQSDGNLRPSDNWQKGIPITAYMKSKFRHFISTWSNHRNCAQVYMDTIEESLCAELFNTMGMLHEILKAKKTIQEEYNEISKEKEEKEAGYIPPNPFKQKGQTCALTELPQSGDWKGHRGSLHVGEQPVRESSKKENS